MAASAYTTGRVAVVETLLNAGTSGDFSVRRSKVLRMLYMTFH